jgi:hypothetical protein
LFVASLTLYRSWAVRDVLGRWSRSYAAFLIAAVSGWILLIAFTLQRTRSTPIGPVGRISRRLVGWAVFLWGIAYLWTALDSETGATRVFDLNLIGSTVPIPSLLEWAAGALAALAGALWAGRQLRSEWHNLALTTATCLAILVLGEGAARVKAVTFPETQGFPTNSAYLWRRRYVTLNSLGFRDGEHDLQAAHGTKRLLVVGDSCALGTGLEHVADRFGEQVLPRLARRTGRTWELLNASMDDTHTLQHIAFLEKMLPYRPDLVVLLYVFNDIDYLYPVTLRPRLLSKDDTLDRLRPSRLLFLNSYLFQELYVRWRKAAVAFDRGPAGKDPYEDENLLVAHMRDLARFAAIGRTAGASVRIVPFDHQIGASSRLRARYESFVRHAEAAGLQLCSLERAFERYDPVRLQVNSLDAHPSALAERLAAEATEGCLSCVVRSQVVELKGCGGDARLPDLVSAHRSQ